MSSAAVGTMRARSSASEMAARSSIYWKRTAWFCVEWEGQRGLEWMLDALVLT